MRRPRGVLLLQPGRASLTHHHDTGMIALERCAMAGWAGVFRFLCHQISARSPAFEGAVFPVCFRCAGLYGGLLCSYVFLALRGGLAQTFPERKLAFFAAGLTVGMPLDGWANALRLWDSAAWLRGLTGLGAGIAIPVLLLPLAASAGTRRSRALPHALPLIWPSCAGLAFVWMLSHPASRAELQLLAAGCVAGLGCLAANLCLAWRSRG